MLSFDRGLSFHREHLRWPTLDALGKGRSSERGDAWSGRWCTYGGQHVWSGSTAFNTAQRLGWPDSHIDATGATKGTAGDEQTLEDGSKTWAWPFLTQKKEAVNLGLCESSSDTKSSGLITLGKRAALYIQTSLGISLQHLTLEDFFPLVCHYSRWRPFIK